MLVFNQARGPWKFLRYRARLRRAYSIMRGTIYSLLLWFFLLYIVVMLDHAG